jgi:hypothetical protein
MTTHVIKGGMAEALVDITSIIEDVTEIERHLHGGARWFGASPGPAAPGLLTSLLPWRATSNATAGLFGTAIELFNGAENFDISTSVLYFDPHQLFITAVEAVGTYKVRFAYSQYDGVSAHTYANMAAAVAAKKYTEVVFRTDDTKTDSTPIEVMSGRISAGSKLWCQVAKSTADAKYIEFLVGLHTYSA